MKMQLVPQFQEIQIKLLYSTIYLLQKTIVKKGSRQEIVKTQNQEKLLISVILTILADGSKLEPPIIFKAKDRSTVYNQFQNDEHVLKKKNAMSNLM